jgi:hypothetical protein
MASPQRTALMEKLAAISREKYQLKVSADWRFRQFFNFLQVSPSYELARLASTGKLNPKHPRPKDFAHVMRTFKAFGDTRQIEFWDWWFKRAQFQFGMSQEPAVTLIMDADVRRQASDSEIEQGKSALEHYLKTQRPDEGLPASLMLAVPLNGSRNKILKRVGEMVDRFYDHKVHQVTGAPYQLIHDRTRETTLTTAMRVLRARAALPRAPLFVIGNRSKIQTQYETDEKLKRIARIRDQRRRMETLTSRHLHRAYLLAENAPREKFPSLDPLPEDLNRPKFNPFRLNAEIRATKKWMEGRVKQLKALQAKHMKPS